MLAREKASNWETREPLPSLTEFVPLVLAQAKNGDVQAVLKLKVSFTQ
jgi:hypothetical protein